MTIHTYINNSLHTSGTVVLPELQLHQSRVRSDYGLVVCQSQNPVTTLCIIYLSYVPRSNNQGLLLVLRYRQSCYCYCYYNIIQSFLVEWGGDFSSRPKTHFLLYCRCRIFKRTKKKHTLSYCTRITKYSAPYRTYCTV